MTTTIGPALGQNAVMNQAGSYDAISARRAFSGFERGEGVATYGSFRISQRGAGANMSVDVNMDEGAWVRGDAVALQGLYYVAPHASTINETITTAHATLPRLDMVVLEIKDHAHDTSGSSLAQTRIVAGTATSGATLDNRTGAAALPDSAMLLADVLVAAADTSITDSEIRDRRPFNAGIPPLLTDIDQCALLPVYMRPVVGSQVGSGADLGQAAVLCSLPRRIAAATRIRWKYRQEGTTALTGNYVLGIYEASGRKIIDTGSVAFTGAVSTMQVRSETITATTLEPGLYYLLFGIDTTNAGSIYYQATDLKVDPTTNEAATGPWGPNLSARSASGGVTAPATILAFTDVNGITAQTLTIPPVPLVTLSVG